MLLCVFCFGKRANHLTLTDDARRKMNVNRAAYCRSFENERYYIVWTYDIQSHGPKIGHMYVCHNKICSCVWMCAEKRDERKPPFTLDTRNLHTHNLQ